MQRLTYNELIKLVTLIRKCPLQFYQIILLVICLLSSNIAATQSNTGVQSVRLELNKDIPPLKIAIRENNSPFSLVLPNGKVTGLYADIWKAWSQVTGRSIVFLPGSYVDNIKSLKNGDADFHAGLFVNDEREEWAVFSSPIDRVQTGLFFHGDVLDTSPLEDMGGKTVSVGQDSFQETFLRSNYPQIKLVTFADANDAINQLMNKEIDAIVSESAFLYAQLAKLGIVGALTQREQPIFSNTAHALIPKRNKQLLDIINQGIKKLPLDKIIRLEKKWLRGYPAYFETFSTSLVSSLSISEQEWLLSNDHFVLGIDPAWSPFEFIDEKGNYSGISSEYVARIAQMLSIEMTPDKGLSWAQIIDKVKKRELDILPGATATKEREEYMLFSDSYVSFPNVIVTRKDADQIQSLSDLRGKVIAVVEDYAIAELIKNNHPDIELKLVDDIFDGLSLVQDKEALGYIDNFAVISHYMTANEMDDLKVALFSRPLKRPS